MVAKVEWTKADPNDAFIYSLHNSVNNIVTRYSSKSNNNYYSRNGKKSNGTNISRNKLTVSGCVNLSVCRENKSQHNITKHGSS